MQFAGGYMGSSDRTLARMRTRVAQLCGNFGQYLQFFEDSGTFVGPSVYFHNKTISIRKKRGAAGGALQCDEFFDFLYATLTAWGMHRMGPGNTKLCGIEDIKHSFRAQARRIEKIEGYTITEITRREALQVARNLWAIISSLEVSVAEAQIVANSKALHHLLPSLIPPIDRSYTYNFFYNRNNLSISEREAFQEMYLQFHHIAVTSKPWIQRVVGKGWNTSETKAIHNAIVGYVLKELRD